jgi:hypothetical protein
MYIAPLNLDLFFKKVFSNKRIAKRFLECLLGITITEIKLLSVESKMTDDAVTVKFDFRCKINGHYVIIEMQQKYKIDVVKRFYLYHCVSTALQLETLKPIKVVKPNGETYMEKNYSGLEPVITLIWMVDDMLGFEDDYIAFTTLPEAAKDFISNADLWEQPLDKILEERKKTLKILDNKTKGLDFFTQNRLIYVLQKNILKNQRVGLPYFKYFDFANISRNKDNKEEDFLKYKDDKDMVEFINRLRKDKLTSEEFKYVSDIHSYDIYIARIEQEHKESIAKKLANQKKRLEKMAFEHQLILIQKAEQEKQKAEQEKQKAEQLKIKLAKMMLLQGETIPKISEVLDISIEDTTELVEKIQKNEV